jgi:hypothetical protein
MLSVRGLPLHVACGMIASTEINVAKSRRQVDREAFDETGS